MAITIDKTSIGSSAIDSSSSTIAFTTSQAVASGGFIVLEIGWPGSQTLSSVAGGALTWTVDKTGTGSNSDGTHNTAIVSAQAPAGLAISTTITATLSGSVAGARSIGGSSFTGVKTSSPVDGTPPAVAAFDATAWATNSATLSAGSVLVGTAYTLQADATSTPTSPSVEIFDVNGGAGSFAQTAAYRIEASSGSYTVAGTWSTSRRGIAIAVAYLAASAADVIPDLVMAPQLLT